MKQSVAGNARNGSQNKNDVFGSSYPCLYRLQNDFCSTKDSGVMVTRKTIFGEGDITHTDTDSAAHSGYFRWGLGEGGVFTFDTQTPLTERFSGFS